MTLIEFTCSHMIVKVGSYDLLIACFVCSGVLSDYLDLLKQSLGPAGGKIIVYQTNQTQL